MTNNARYNGKASFEEWKKEWALEERYNFHAIEAKWQKIWDEEKAYKVEISSQYLPLYQVKLGDETQKAPAAHITPY